MGQLWIIIHPRLQQCLTMLIGLRISITEGTKTLEQSIFALIFNVIQEGFRLASLILGSSIKMRSSRIYATMNNHHSGILRTMARGRVKLETLPQVAHHHYIHDDDHRSIMQNYSCRKGKSHIKSKGENQLTTDYFEALFETSKWECHISSGANDHDWAH